MAMNPNKVFELIKDSKKPVVTLRHLREDFSKFKEKILQENEDVEFKYPVAVDWIIQLVNAFTQAIDLNAMDELVTSYQEGIFRDFKVNLSLPKNQEAKDLPVETVKELLSNIYASLDDMLQYSDQCEVASTYLSACKRELTSLKKVITQFVHSDRDIDLWKKGVKAQKGDLVDEVTTDIEVYLSRIQSLISIMDSCIESLNRKRSILFKKESSIRTISKYDEMDFQSQIRQSGGFAVEQV